MIKAFFKKTLRHGGKHGQHQRSSQRDSSCSQAGEDSVARRQNSDLSACFDMDLPDVDVQQQPAVVFLPGMPTPVVIAPTGEIGPSEMLPAEHAQQEVSIHGRGLGKNDDSTSHRRERAQQRRKEGIVNDPMTSLYQISALMSLSTFFEYKLSSDAARAVSQLTPSSSSSSSQPSPGIDVGRLGLVLSRWGYQVTLRKVLAARTYWTKSMYNTFLVVLDSSGGAAVEYVLDPNFKELFRVGVMSKSYRAIWQSLNPMFIGMPCQLQTVVQLLCEEMELSFLEAGKPCPPWRSASATMGRWMSQQVVDVPVPSAAASAQEAQDYLTCCSRLNSSSFGGSPGAAGGTPPGAPGSSDGDHCSSSSGGLGTQKVAVGPAMAGAGVGAVAAKEGPHSPGRMAVPKGCEAAAAWGALSSSSGSRSVSEPRQCQRGFAVPDVAGAGAGRASSEAGPQCHDHHHQQQQGGSWFSGSKGGAFHSSITSSKDSGLQLKQEGRRGSSCMDDEIVEDHEGIVYTVGSVSEGRCSEEANCSIPGSSSSSTHALLDADPKEEQHQQRAMRVAAAEGVGLTVPLPVAPGAAAAVMPWGFTAPPCLVLGVGSTASTAPRAMAARPRSLLTQRLQESRGLEHTMRGGRAARTSDPWSAQHAGMWLARTEALIAEKQLTAAMQEERRQAQLRQQQQQQAVAMQLHLLQQRQQALEFQQPLVQQQAGQVGAQLQLGQVQAVEQQELLEQQAAGFHYYRGQQPVKLLRLIPQTTGQAVPRAIIQERR